MKALDSFNIDIFKLSNGSHDYHFEITNEFFELFPGEIVTRGAGDVNLVLTKSETMIDLDFKINVVVELECDRSLELFDYNIDLTKGLILKFGEEEYEQDDEIIVISRDKQQINVAQHIYEFIGLAVPMKKLHPKFKDEDTGDEIIYSSDNDKSKEDDDEAIDPRWSKLQNLK